MSGGTGHLTPALSPKGGEGVEFRVRMLLRFPFSPVMRRHTIAQLLKDPESAPYVPEAARLEARDWWFVPAFGFAPKVLVEA